LVGAIVFIAMGVPQNFDPYTIVTTLEGALAGILAATLVAAWLVPDLRVAVPKRSGWSDLRGAIADRRLLLIGALTFAVTFSAQGMVLTTLTLLVRARRVSLVGLGVQGSSSLLMGIMVISAAVIMPFAGYLVYKGEFSLFWAATAGRPSAPSCSGRKASRWIPPAIFTSPTLRTFPSVRSRRE